MSQRSSASAAWPERRMRNRSRTWRGNHVTLNFMRIFVASLLCGGLCVGVMMSGSMLSGQSLSGRRAPSFSLPDSNQVQHDILDYRGKWLLMTFVSTQACPHCAPLSKELEKLQSAKISVLYVMLPPEDYSSGPRYAAENK